MTAASIQLRELAADLAYASGQGVEKVARDLIQTTALEVQQRAAAGAPRDTGKLSASIRVVWIDALVAEVGPAGVPYAAFQEYGTGTRGEFPGQPYEIRPKRPGGVLVFEVNGRRVFAKVVRHPGVKAHPFMRPAALGAVEPFADRLAERGQLLLTKGPRSAL